MNILKMIILYIQLQNYVLVNNFLILLFKENILVKKMLEKYFINQYVLFDICMIIILCIEILNLKMYFIVIKIKLLKLLILVVLFSFRIVIWSREKELGLHIIQHHRYFKDVIIINVIYGHQVSYFILCYQVSHHLKEKMMQVSYNVFEMVAYNSRNQYG